MRRFVLLSLTIGSLIGLPRLADVFREKSIPSKSLPDGSDIAALSGRTENAPQSEAALLSVKKPLDPSSLAPQPAEMRAATPLSEDELVLAIKKELIRLGFYRGALSSHWGRLVRIAAYRFARQAGLDARNLRPTNELLQVLRSTKSNDAKSITKGASESTPLNMQLATLKPDGNSGAGVPVPQANTPAKASGDSYLPPWMPSSSDRSVANSGKFATGMAGVSQTAARGGNYKIRRVHISRHSRDSRREFATINSDRHYRRGRRVPSYLRNANFSWPGM